MYTASTRKSNLHKPATEDVDCRVSSFRRSVFAQLKGSLTTLGEGLIREFGGKSEFVFSNRDLRPRQSCCFMQSVDLILT